MIDYDYIREVVTSVKNIFMKQVNDNEIHLKGLADIVTDSDIKIQQIITKRLKDKYPDIIMIAEELEQDSIVEKDKSYFILDPIDGTTNFKYGLNLSAVSLAYVENGTVIYGIIYNPYTDEVFEGYEGKGAYLNGEKIYANQNKYLKDCVVSFGTCPYNKSYAKEIFESIYNLFMKSFEVRRLGSAALDMCYVACGRLDVFLEKELRVWDIAAGYVIAKEAGAIVVKYSGEEFETIKHGGVIVANQYLIKEIMETI